MNKVQRTLIFIIAWMIPVLAIFGDFKTDSEITKITEWDTDSIQLRWISDPVAVSLMLQKINEVNDFNIDEQWARGVYNASISWKEDLEQSYSTTTGEKANWVIIGALSGESAKIPRYKEGTVKCAVWAFKPEGEHDYRYLQTLGHEVLHCFKGNYHD